ncbi:MAG: rRNA maturation RNase YbeY [Candidatus Omnitrophota bacterium]
MLQAEGVTQAELSVVFVTDSQIKALNKRYLQHDRPTDVLAFDLREKAEAPRQRRASGAKRKRLEGEIVISAMTAVRQAAEYHSTPARETILYVVHGILHLCGYDDRREKDIKKMRKREREVMAILEKQRLLPL